MSRAPFSKKFETILKKNHQINNNMDITQNSSEREAEQTKQSQQLNTLFQTLKELPTRLFGSPCVLYKHEILICGGWDKRTCYSYHTIKNEYKFICEYPSDIQLNGHCVVKLVDNNNKHSNQITLLSFGSDRYGRDKHTLVMKYVSVWSNISNKLNKSNEFNNYNQWVPFTDNHNNPIIIGRYQDIYEGARAVISGSNNHLLFITYQTNNISVFNLNTFQFSKHYFLPNTYISYHCFVLNPKNGQDIMKTNEEKKQNYQMLLFCKKIGLLIEYDEDSNNFQFHKLHVCDDITSFKYYAYVCIDDAILFFGGYGNDVSKSVLKYSIQENKWTIFQSTLPSQLHTCAAILSTEDNYIHIIGGKDYKHASVSTHMKTKVHAWSPSPLAKKEIKYIIEYWIRTSEIKLGWIDDFDQIIIKYSKMN
ncbi:hypothetical protein RFI_30083 [Reticulomyxa filosa]|uniref:Kelch motif family protein n=1 Tax=Reticulomyxa filosa TaxID=46433 RepID=X6M2S6_RETFI|nr:hypothetical protein RFI_30083 [Reticulomyxa filosa]|eukprot:ETO07310.1 hypothetical protein RFI_30083 [Reticulomyxa filosa]